jgi:hypothetical protein
LDAKIFTNDIPSHTSKNLVCESCRPLCSIVQFLEIQIIKALKVKIPTFAQLSLLHFDDSKIPKRSGGLDIKSIKEDEIEPMASS